MVMAVGLGAVACGAPPPPSPREAPTPSARDATVAAPVTDPPVVETAPTVDAHIKDDAERAKAFGYFIDSPRPFAVIDQGVAIAERLRRRYGIDTGNPDADRRAAALKFQTEVLDRLVFRDEEIAEMVRRLGYSLDPAQCRNTCDNVRRLAAFELQKIALEAFADGRRLPGRMP